jgi:hypothetical protein
MRANRLLNEEDREREGGSNNSDDEEGIIRCRNKINKIMFSRNVVSFFDHLQMNSNFSHSPCKMFINQNYVI